MLTLPDAIVALLVPFATLFTSPTWRKAQLLLVGAILTPGQRTVAAALRVMGRRDQRDYARYHEVLNRAVWSSRQAARILLVLLLQHLDGGDGPLIFGIDETLERRRGAKIRARAIYRDPVRSSRSQVVKASGLRWISLMWLGHVPWAGRHWALPVLTVLAPSTRYYQQQGRQHKKLTDWARQMVMQLRRWLPHRPLVLVGDNSYAVLDLLHCCQSLREPVTLIARLRLDAALYAPAPPRQPGQNGRPPLKGPRRPPLKVFLEQTDVTWASAEVAWYDGITRAVELTSQTAVWYRSGKPPVLIRWVLIRDPQGSFATQALLCTDPAADPTQILEWFVLRWQLEVTFHEVRTHLGVETQLRASGPMVRARIRVDGGLAAVCRRFWGDDVGLQWLWSRVGRMAGHRPMRAVQRARLWAITCTASQAAFGPHHARPTGTLLLDHPGRPRVAETAPHDPAQGRLVRLTVADLRGCHRPGASPPVAGVGRFLTVGR